MGLWHVWRRAARERPLRAGYHGIGFGSLPDVDPPDDLPSPGGLEPEYLREARRESAARDDRRQGYRSFDEMLCPSTRTRAHVRPAGTYR